MRQQGVLECAIITMNMANWTSIFGMLKGVHINHIIGSIIVSQSLRKMLKKLLELEESAFRGNWRDFVRFQQQMIDKEKEVPSPNRPEKRKNNLKIFIAHLKSMIIK